MRQINFLIGRNNHGKSSILRCVQLFCDIGIDTAFVSTTLTSGRPRRSPRQPFGAEGDILQRLVLVRLSERVMEEQRLLLYSDWEIVKRRALESELALARYEDDLLVWVPVADNAGIQVEIELRDVQAWGIALGVQPEFHTFTSAMQQCIARSDIPPGGLSHAFIPAFREIQDTPQPTDFELNRGIGLIRELHRWQQPDQASPSAGADRARFDSLTELIQDVLEDDDARIQIPYNLRAIQVSTRQAGRFLDLGDLGDGIAQVLMIGAAALRHSKTIICIEEPEIHLHAGLQRKLIRHLQRTSNQYIIATHSASIIDTPDAAIFHVVHDGSGTRVTSAVTVDSVAMVCDDLGVRASDILQANYVVWVEGPADRLYWRRWLELVDPSLQEGVHYVLVSYGGRLIDEVDLTGGQEAVNGDNSSSAVDKAESTLVDILRLGRWSSIVADSDRRSADDELHPSIRRLREEADRSRTAEVVVVESVRTVENLLPDHVLEQALRTCHPVLGATFSAPSGPFDAPFEGVNSGSFSKVRIAREAAPLITAAGMPDELVEQVRRVAARIRAANGLGTPPPFVETAA